jgi:excisionase family DNA binding protein
MQLLDPTAVAALLGLHPRTIVLYFRAGKIPGAFRLGGRHWRISRADLETYLAARARNDNKAMTHLDPSVVYYGPHACPQCGQMIVKVAEETGGAAFSVPDGPIYPNSAWQPHVCDPAARATWPGAVFSFTAPVAIPNRSAPDGCNTEAPAKPPDPLPAPYEIRLPAGLRSFTIIIGQ